MLFIKSLPRMIRNASKDASRHFSMTFSSALSIGIALLIAMVMTVVSANMNEFARNIESEVVVQVSLRPGTTDIQREEMSTKLNSLEGVGSVVYSTKDQQLNELIAENGAIFSRYQGEDKNPLFDVFTIHMKDASQVEAVSDAARAMSQTVSVTYGGDIVSKMISLFSAARTGGYVLSAFMIVLAIFLTRTSVKMTIASRSEELAIMRQVGAYNWYITTPFVFEGLITGFWGALVPALLALIGYPFLYNVLNGVFLSDMFVLVPPFPFAALVALGVFAIGLLTGALGSWLAVRKYLRWVR